MNLGNKLISDFGSREEFNEKYGKITSSNRDAMKRIFDVFLLIFLAKDCLQEGLFLLKEYSQENVIAFGIRAGINGVAILIFLKFLFWKTNSKINRLLLSAANILIIANYSETLHKGQLEGKRVLEFALIEFSFIELYTNIQMKIASLILFFLYYHIRDSLAEKSIEFVPIFTRVSQIILVCLIAWVYYKKFEQYRIYYMYQFKKCWKIKMQKLYRCIFNMLPEGIAVFFEDDVILHNKQMEKMIGSDQPDDKSIFNAFMELPIMNIVETQACSLFIQANHLEGAMVKRKSFSFGKDKEKSSNEYQKINVHSSASIPQNTNISPKVGQSSKLLSRNSFSSIENTINEGQEVMNLKAMNLFQWIQTQKMRLSRVPTIEEIYFEKAKKGVIKLIKEHEIIFEATKNIKLYIRLIPCLICSQLAMLAIVQDVSVHYQKKVLEEKDSFKDQLLSTVSHELRTPLNCNLLMLDAIKPYLSPELQDSYLIPALNSSKMLLSLINDLLDQNQIKNGRLQLVYVEFDLNKLLVEVFNLMKMQIEFKGIHAKLTIMSNIPTIFYSDPNRIKQILINLLGKLNQNIIILLGNASKFTKKGEISLTAEMEQVGFNKNYVKISVSDTGKGLKESEIPLLTKKQFTIRDESNPQGVGLGLTIVEQLVERLGPINQNNLKIESTFGVGSTFSFFLEDKNTKQKDFAISEKELEEDAELSDSLSAEDPLNENKIIPKINLFELKSKKRLDMPTLQTNKENMESTENKNNISSLNKSQKIEVLKSSLKTKNCKCKDILIVDDNMYNLYALQKILEAYGLKVDSANCGEQTLEAVNSNINADVCHKQKVIFLDIEMPDMDGQTVANKLREILMGKKIEMTLIACTAQFNEEIWNKCKENGFDDALQKPVERFALENLLLGLFT